MAVAVVILGLLIGVGGLVSILADVGGTTLQVPLVGIGCALTIAGLGWNMTQQPPELGMIIGHVASVLMVVFASKFLIKQSVLSEEAGYQMRGGY